MTERTVLHVVRASAIYDLAVTLVFALPPTARWVFDALTALHHQLGLPGSTPDSADPHTVMFANLMGSLVTVWAIYRIVRPSWQAGVADTAGRVLFSLGMATALLSGGSPLVWGMLVLEIGWGIVQGIAVSGPLRASRHRTLHAGARPTLNA